MESTGQGRVCGLTRFDMCERCIGNAFLSKKDNESCFNPKHILLKHKCNLHALYTGVQSSSKCQPFARASKALQEQ